MGFNRFSLLLATRLFVILLGLVALAFFFTSPGYHAATLLTAFVVVGLTWEVFQFVSRTNQEICRFLDAARYADFGQRFNLGSMGAGFGELGELFTAILERFREYRTVQESELRHLKALVEHVPVPLISVHMDGRVELWNNAARRLFGMAYVARIEDLEQFGTDFIERITTAQAGEKFLVQFNMDNMERRLTMAVSQVIIEGKTERLISLQDIQSELDVTQLEAWQDLVRVLTHEIMNSITPVASLARTAVDLVDDVSAKIDAHPDIVDELNDVRDAVSTVASRSDGLMKFVSSYRRLTQLPSPAKTRFRLDKLFADVVKLATVNWDELGVSLVTNIEPSQLDLFADRDMVEQILINILQNSEHALENSTNGQVSLTARLNKRGHVTIEVSDNGPGIPPDITRKIFVPFFTTKREGSGVGLALSRQVMIAHGGTISVSPGDQGGARFTLVF
ncbi:MAG: ATP-binding protein [Gammaproteobacteria bacterium]|nr:ATP-binding protein [Gammaproteobacteria bacterium]